MTLVSRSASSIRRRSFPGPRKCSCPTNSSRERGRIRTARGATRAMFFLRTSPKRSISEEGYAALDGLDTAGCPAAGGPRRTAGVGRVAGSSVRAMYLPSRSVHSPEPRRGAFVVVEPDCPDYGNLVAGFVLGGYDRGAVQGLEASVPCAASLALFRRVVPERDSRRHARRRGSICD